MEPKPRKVDMYHQIQERIQYLMTEKKITPIIILDEAQYLRTDIFNDLKLLLNFNMDSKDLAILILVGQPILNDILSRNVHDALKQRIIVNYSFLGMDFEETRRYVWDRFKVAGLSENIVDEATIQALASNCNGSTRKLNLLIEKCLWYCCNQKINNISTEIVMLAHNDINLI